MMDEVNRIRTVIEAVDTVTPVVRKIQTTFKGLGNTLTETFDKVGDPLKKTFTVIRKPISNLEDVLDKSTGSFVSSNDAMMATDAIMEDFRTGLKRTTSEISRNGVVTTSLSKTYDEFGNLLNQNERQITDNRRRFKMYYLSVMFGAMQMQRTLGRVFADWRQDFFKITENTTTLGQATLRLQGAMTFLSVSIMTALEPVLVPLVERLIDLVNWFTSLPPEVLRLAGLFVIGGLFTASIIFAGAQIALFIDGLITMGIEFGWLTQNIKTGAVSIVGHAKGMKTGVLAEWGLMSIAIIGIIAYLALVWKNSQEAQVAMEKAKNLAIKGKFQESMDYQIAGIVLWRHAFIEAYVDIGKYAVTWARELVATGRTALEDLRFQLGLISPEKYIKALDEIRKFREETVTKGTFWEQMQMPVKVRELLKAQTPIDVIMDLLGAGPQVIDVLKDYGVTQEEINNATLRLVDSLRKQSNETLITAELLETKLRPVLADVNNITNQMTADVNNQTIPTYQKLAVEISNVTEKIVGMTDMWKVAGAAGVWHITTAGGMTIEEKQRLIASAQPLQKGGFIRSEGLAYLHAGETVIPKGETNTSIGDINVNITTGPISSPADENELARKVSDRILADIQNYTKYVGHF